MTRILDLSPTNEDIIVSRILVLVHKAVDDNFPRAEKPNRQFSKTVFSDDGFEKTGQIFVHSERKDSTDSLGDHGVSDQLSVEHSVASELTNFKSNELQISKTEFGAAEPTDTDLTSRAHSANEMNQIIREPLEEVSQDKNPRRSFDESTNSDVSPLGVGTTSPYLSKKKLKENVPQEFSEDDATKLEDTFGLMQQQLEPTWVSRVTIAFLLAGVILLVYVLLW